jgi:hypothetical protein
MARARLRREGIEDDFAVLLRGLLLFRSEDAELAGESVAISIEVATALAFGRLGRRVKRRLGPVEWLGREARWGC